MFSIEAIPCLTALPLQARLGLLFSFSAYLRFLSTASLRVETHWFPLTLGWPLPPDSLTTGSHTSNRAGLGLGWCCLPTRPSDRPKIAAQGQVWFFSPERVYPSPFRGRDGILFIFGVSGSPWQLPLATAGHSWLNRAGLGLCWCRSPTRPPKSHTGPHRGEFGFTAFSWCASFAAALLAGAPGGNLPPRGWAGSCKAASRFSQFHPMSTLLWVAFR